MSAERLSYCVDLLEADAPLPVPTRQWLRDALQSILTGADPVTALGLEVKAARQERDDIIRQNAGSLAWSNSKRARILSEQAKRLHRGRRVEYQWIAKADRICRLPESIRMYHKILQ